MKKKKVIPFIVFIIFSILIMTIVQFRWSNLYNEQSILYLEFEASYDEALNYQIFYADSKEEQFNDNKKIVYPSKPSVEFIKHRIGIPINSKFGKVRIGFGQPVEDYKIKNIELIGDDIKYYDDSEVKNTKKFNIDRIIEDIEGVSIDASHRNPYLVFLDIGVTANDTHLSLNFGIIVLCLFLASIFSMFIYYILETQSENKHIVTVLFIFLLFCLITIPLIFISKDEIDYKENRSLSKYPDYFVNDGFNYSFSNEFEAWFEDHFGFRKELHSLHSFVDREILHSSIKNNRAHMGKDNWLFLGGNSIKAYQGVDLYTDRELQKIANNLTQIKNWLNNEGVIFIMYIAPDKQTIYEEFYPDNIIKANDYSKTNQLLDYLGNNTDVNVITSHESLSSNKNEQLYYKGGTHWTKVGAFIGYTDIMNAIADYYPDVNILERNQFINEKDDHVEREISDMLNLDYSSYDLDYYEKLTPLDPYSFSYIEDDHKKGIITVNDSEKYTLLMFRDSFTINMTPYIAESFNEVNMVWDFDLTVNQYLIEDKQPDIVVIETVERFLNRLAEENFIFK